MANKNKSGGFPVRNTILMIYVGVCVLMIVFTLGLAFLETAATDAPPTATMRATIAPAVLTLQAEDAERYESEHGQGQGRGRGGASHDTPEATAAPSPTPTN